ncbi:transposase family protein [Paraburkholderia sp. SIMBA_049]
MNPFEPDRLYALFEQYRLPAQTQEAILVAIRRDLKLVQAPLMCTASSMRCPKMGIQIHMKEKSISRPASLHYIFDDAIDGYIDQPFELNLRYAGKRGKVIVQNVTPQYLIWGEDGFRLQDWETPAAIRGLVSKNPYRYVQSGDELRSPPAEEAARTLGLSYEIRSTAEIAEMQVRNWDYLRTYLRIPFDEPNPGLRMVRERFRCDAFCSLEEVLQGQPDAIHDDVLRAIAHQQIATDFRLAFVGDRDRFMLFRDECVRDLYRKTHFGTQTFNLGAHWSAKTLRPGGKILYLGARFTTIAVVEQHVVLQPDAGGDPVELSHNFVEKAYLKGTLCADTDCDQLDDPLISAGAFRFAGPKAIDRAIKMQSLFNRWSEGERSPEVCQFSDRTYRTYKKKLLIVTLQNLQPITAFLPQNHRKGSTAPKLSEEADEIFVRVFKENYETLCSPNRWHVYGILRQEMKKEGVPVPSKTAFLKRVRRTVSYKSTARRLGHKAAYQEKPFFWSLSRETPRHGDYPMQYVHIDHTQLQIVVTSILTGEVLDKPWLTLVFCSFSRRVVGFHLSMRSPSYHTDMCAIFDAVCRVGRAPDMIIADWGSDFHSIDFETLAAFLHAELRFRPKSAPRAGCVIERMFGITQSEFIDNLPGNTKILRNPRMAARESDPFSLAALTLVDLYEGLEEYFRIYDETRHPTLLVSPLTHYQTGLDRAGRRLHRLRREDDLIPAALPSVRGQTRVLDAQRGIKVGRHYYRNQRLERQDLHGQTVPVKAHLLYPETIFAFVDREWHPLYSDRFDFLLTESRYTRRAAFAELLLLHTWVDDSKILALEKRTALIMRLTSLARSRRGEDAMADETARPTAFNDLSAIMESPESELQRKFARAFLELTEEHFEGEDTLY